jgi:N-acetylglucosamine-6-phosphate deacetylase
MTFNLPESLALVNGLLVLPNRIASGMALVVEHTPKGGKIADLIPEEHLPQGIEHLDAGRRWITPGLIDIHTHGGWEHTFNEPDQQAFEQITRHNARRGVTGLLATVATAPMDELFQVFDFIRSWMAEPRPGAQVLGAYLESPYISPAQCGALDPKNLGSPQDGSAASLLDYADVLKIFMLAPELPGAVELAAQISERGVIPAAGHSMAKESEVLAAMQAGLRHVTHLFSAMSTTVREGPWRKPGLLETALVNEGLTVEMIADNKHLPPTLMKLAYRCAGPDRMCVVSDATSGAGLPDGTRFRMGQMEYEVAEGVGMMFDRSAFAGSTTLLNQMIPVLVEAVGVPLPEAIRMTSLNPARLLGLDDRKGSLEAGKDADLAIFNPDFSAWRTMISGRWVTGE